MKQLLISIFLFLTFVVGLAQEQRPSSMSGTYWQALPHSSTLTHTVGGIYLCFDDSLVYKILIAPTSKTFIPLSQHTYVQGEKAVLVNGCVGRFHTPDSLFLFKVEKDSLVDRYVRIEESEFNSLLEDAESFQSIHYNSMMNHILMSQDTRYVINEEAGTLAKNLDQIPTARLKECETLVIAGPLNGNDIIVLYAYLSTPCDYPNIKTLDLSKAWVITDTVPGIRFGVNYSHDGFVKEEGIRYQEPFSKHCDGFDNYGKELVEVVQNEYGYLFEIVPDSIYYRCDASVEGHIMRYSMEQFSHIEHLLLPINTTHIDFAALAYCDNLQEITLPRSVKANRSAAFAHCTNLRVVRVADNSDLLKSQNFMPNPEDADNPFFGCSKDLKIETYPSVPPMVTFRIHGKTQLSKIRVFDQYRVCPLPEIVVDKGDLNRTFSAEITAPRHALITLGYQNMSVIAEEGADLKVDITKQRVEGGPLNDLYNKKVVEIKEYAQKISETEFLIQKAYSADSIRNLKRRKEYYQSRISNSIVDACRELSFSPIAPYLLFSSMYALTPIQELIMLSLMSDENAANPAIRNLWRWARERSLADNIDWKHWADTAQMKKVKVERAGTLHTLFDSTFVSNIHHRLYISGPMNQADFRWLRQFIRDNRIHALDLSEVETTMIPDSAFCFNSSIQYVNLPKGVRTIGACAFFDSNQLQEVVFPECLTTIKEKAFDHCGHLYHINLPPALQTIEYHGFYYCTNLKEVYLPAQLQKLGAFAFGKCENLRYINIPASTTSIGPSVLINCPEVQVVVHPDNPNFISVENQIVGRTEADRKQLFQY